MEYLAEHMRQADRDEVWSLSRYAPLEALQHSMEVSRGTLRVAADEHGPFYVFGVGQLTVLGQFASPWALGTDGVYDHVFEVLRASKRVVSAWKLRYPHMLNYVDARNKLSVRWLAWLGFTIEEPVKMGYDSLPFHPFHLGGLDV